MSTKIILLFSLALDETHAVFNKSFATMLHAIGAHTGSDIFHFVVFLKSISSLRAYQKYVCAHNKGKGDGTGESKTYLKEEKIASFLL